MEHLVRADLDEEIYPGFYVARLSARVYRKRRWWLADGGIGAVDYLDGGKEKEILWHGESEEPLEIFEWRIRVGRRRLPPSMWFDDAGTPPFTANVAMNEAIRYFIGKLLSERAQAVMAAGIFAKVAEKFQQAIFRP